MLDVDTTLAGFVVTESVPQVFDVSQTVIVALPAAKPETVSSVPDKFAEATPVLELLDMV
jgi:hypothetical protein